MHISQMSAIDEKYLFYKEDTNQFRAIIPLLIEMLLGHQSKGSDLQLAEF